MDAEVKELLDELLQRAGSILQAGELAGVSSRHVQKWVSGHSSPSPASQRRIRAALDGDNLHLRDTRIEHYAGIVAEGRSPFCCSG
jgi:hypothetical protein